MSSLAPVSSCCCGAQWMLWVNVCSYHGEQSAHYRATPKQALSMPPYCMAMDPNTCHPIAQASIAGRNSGYSRSSLEAKALGVHDGQTQTGRHVGP